MLLTRGRAGRYLHFMVSAIDRLLDELSWEGNARKYRGGGRGLENVLTAEVFQALDFLPRDAFLGAVLRGAVLVPESVGAEDPLENAAATWTRALSMCCPAIWHCQSLASRHSQT